jgi:hypothetical protein
METGMTERVLLVDLENVQKIDLSQVPADARVMIFYGVTQKKLPEELVVQAQPLGARLKWIKISGQGPNALDFHIAYYLGQELASNPALECAIFSRDTGFDPRAYMPPGEFAEGRISRSEARRANGSLHPAADASQKRESAAYKAQKSRWQSEVLVPSPRRGRTNGPHPTALHRSACTRVK